MAKLIKSKRIRFRQVSNLKPASPVVVSGKGSNKTVTPLTKKQYNSAIRRRKYYNDLLNYERDRSRVIYSNVYTAVRLTFRVVCIALALGFFFVLWNKNFDFSVVGPSILGSDFAPFDFTEAMEYIGQHLPDSPAASFLEGVLLLGLSLEYVIGFAFKALIGIFSL